MKRKMFKRDKNKSEDISQSQSKDNDLLLFFIGILLLGAGLFMLSKRVMVHSSWFGWSIGGFDLSSGTVTIPLIIGIIWYFVKPKSIVPKIIIVLGVIFIIATIIMSIRIHFVTTSLFDYILIFGMTGAGTGLLLRTVFRNKD